MITAKQAQQETRKFYNRDGEFDNYCSSIESEILKAAKQGSCNIFFKIRKRNPYYANELSNVLLGNGFFVEVSVKDSIYVLSVHW